MKTVLKFLLMAVLLSNNAFSNLPQSHRNNNHLSVNSFESGIDRIRKDLNSRQIFNPKSCEGYISKITDFLLHQSGSRYLPLTRSDFDSIEKRGDSIVRKLFLLRLELHNDLKSFYRQGQVSEKCVSEVRKAFRYIRFIEEFIAEARVNLYPNPPKADPLDFSNHPYQFYLNPKYKNFHLKSGDVIVARTSSLISAIISRIGDEDGQFSHAAFVYIDENKTPYIIEMVIEGGVRIMPYEKWRRISNHARTILLRYGDEKWAKSASTKLFNVVRLRQKKAGGIPYDFHMNDSDFSELYCSELILYTFKLSGKKRFPAVKTSFRSMQGSKFLNDLSITASRAFTPSDLELEPEFDLVAEWRNYDKTRDARMEDAIQTSLIGWMSRYGYQLRPTLKSSLGAGLAIVESRVLGIKKDSTPPNMPYGLIESIIRLQDLSKVFEKYLKSKEEKYFQEHGHSLDYMSMLNILKDFRRKDCLNYKKMVSEQKPDFIHPDSHFGDLSNSKVKFHTIFRPQGDFSCD